MNAAPEIASEELPEVEPDSFHLLIVYEDSICCKNAQKTCAHVLSQLEGDGNVTKSEWKFDVLQSRSLRQFAAEDAQSADMIIIAAHADREFPPEFKTWVETWDPSHRDRALVAVMQSESDEFVDCRANCLYLQEIARQKGMDFFASEVGPDYFDRE